MEMNMEISTRGSYNVGNEIYSVESVVIGNEVNLNATKVINSQDKYATLRNLVRKEFENGREL